MAQLAILRFVTRAHPRALALLGIVVLLSTTTGLRAVWADAPSSESVTVTPAEIDQTLNRYFRDDAVVEILRQKFVDRAAKQAGVSVSNPEIDALLAQWNGEPSDGGEAGIGNSSALRREEAREELLAEKIVTGATHLEESDFDRVEVQRIWCATLKEAQNAYMALINSHTLGSNENPQLLSNIQPDQPVNTAVMDGLSQTPTMLGNTQIIRYDQRVDPAAARTLFTMVRGKVLPPTVSLDPAGYQVLIVARQIPGSSLTQADRQVWAKIILQQKIKQTEQEWWAAIDKQVERSKALAGVSSAAPAPPAPAPSTEIKAPTVIKGPAVKSGGDTSGGGAIVLPPPGPGQ